MVEVNWSFVEKVVYINLTKRTERRKSIEFQMEKMGIPADKIIRFDAIENENGALGCVLSHINVLKMAKKNNWKNVLILEDDMIFNGDDESSERINYYFDSLKTVPWDAGLLSGSYFWLKQIHGCFYHVRYSYLSNSYIVNMHYYDKLIDVFLSSADNLIRKKDRNDCGLDVSWNTLMKMDRWYAIYPCVGYQMTGVSDIEHEIMDRECYFKRPLEDIWPTRKE